MIFDCNQTEFVSDRQKEIWRTVNHIVPLEVSLADISDEEVREGCTQIYSCILEILLDMYEHTEDYLYQPRWYTGDYISWMINGSKPLKHHNDEYQWYLREKVCQFGFEYSEETEGWYNDKYPLFCEYYPRMLSLAKERKKNLGGYIIRLDFRLFADKIKLTLDDLLRPLSDKEKAYCLDMHSYATAKGLKVQIRDPYMLRYTYNKLYALEIGNNPFNIKVVYRLDNGKHVPRQFERFIEEAEKQPDKEELLNYIAGGICVCNACGGTKKPEARCGKWVIINGSRRLASACHPAVSKYRRGRNNAEYTDEDIAMLKRLLDIRISQVDAYEREK